jgi:hypothetical protein
LVSPAGWYNNDASEKTRLLQAVCCSDDKGGAAELRGSVCRVAGQGRAGPRPAMWLLPFSSVSVGGFVALHIDVTVPAHG